jgi:vitamin K epoxide reductase family protein
MNKFIPMGWNHNPSDWTERVVALVFVLTGFGIAVYLALFQLGFLASVWDPIFGEGANRVLHSPLTRKLAVPDAALGALGYLLEAVLIAAGSNKRWRDQPWIVTLWTCCCFHWSGESIFDRLSNGILTGLVHPLSRFCSYFDWPDDSRCRRVFSYFAVFETKLLTKRIQLANILGPEAGAGSGE